MKKITSIIALIATSAMLFAGEHIILVKPAGSSETTRTQLKQLFGSELKMQLPGTNEMVIISNTVNLEGAKKKIETVLPNVSVREVTNQELTQLRGNSGSRKK